MSAPTKLKRPATFDHLRSKPLPSRVVEVVLDDEARQELERASSELEKAKLAKADDSEIRKLQKAYDKAKAACDEKTEELLFRSVGRKRWEALVRAYPPTQEQIDDAKEEKKPVPLWDEDAFPAAAVHASIAEPELTLEQVQELWDEWNSGETTRLFMLAYALNNNSNLVDLGKGSSGTNGF